MLHCPTCGRRYAEDVQVCPEDGALLKADATVAAEIAVDPLIGTTLDDKYRLDERLGEGGMGTVYRATHMLIDRPVAVKVLKPRFVEDEAAQERFRREARAAGRLRHSNAVAVTDFGRTPDGFVYIVMELLEGQTLREILAREAPLDIARAVSIMLQISAAVASAHEAGIIHRDLKPANIFVVRRDYAPPVVKVLDFGIAKLAADTVEEGEPATLTQAGVMIGTPRYMSPEQCDGISLSPAADVYSLGIILYEMLTGETPFNGATPLAVALKHSSEPPLPPSELVSGLPPALEELVLHALEKRPENRPADAGAFRRELYSTAERLGLEHAGSASVPTIETLRNAGTETPSGRLVIDIERLRQNRAAAVARNGETTVLSETGESGEVEVSGEHLPVPEPTPETPAIVEPEPPARVHSRMMVDLRPRPVWSRSLRQPAVLASIAVAAVLVVFGIGRFGHGNTSSTTPPAEQPSPSVTAAGAVPASEATNEPTPEPARPQPRETAPEPASGGASIPTSREAPREEGAGREPRREPERAPSQPRRVAPVVVRRSQGGSKIGAIFSPVKKVRKIFKNPF